MQLRYSLLTHLSVIGMVFTFSALQAQEVISLNMKQTIELAREQSPDAAVAKTKFRGSYWQYRYYRAAYLPALTGTAELPNLNRSLARITLPDGTDAFVPRSIMTSNAGLQLNQRVGPTGGSIFMNSSLQRLDILNLDQTSYLSTPVSIGLTQPLFAYNDLKWQKKIEPLYYQEAKKEYVQSMEAIGEKASSLYFDVLIAQNNFNTATQNKSNTDTLYKIAEGRYSLGKIAENELLQLELNLLNAGLAVEQAKVGLGNAMARLRSFLGLNAGDSIVLDEPPVLDSSTVNIERVWALATQNNPQTIAFERMALEAERDVAIAKGKTGLQANIYGQFGLNRSATSLEQAYIDPRDQEQLVVGIQVPILDWGRTKGTVEMARAQQELLQTTLQQNRTDFEQDIKLQAAAYNLQKRQLVIASKANEVAERRYFIARARYMIGKISITDLNIAQTERDAARSAYYSVAKNLWASYYKLRAITLYDLEQNQPLEASPLDILD